MATELTFYSYPGPSGTITITSSTKGVVHVSFEGWHVDGATQKPSAISNEAATQLSEYLAGKRQTFDLPLDLTGTEFQLQVWEEMTRIPYGTFITCSELAKRIGRDGSHRMVGAAVRANPLTIIVPSHRVTNASGKHLGADLTARRQQNVLAFEKAHAKQ